MKEKYDLVVIGGGPGGYHTAIHAAKKGLSTVVIERNKAGGTCLNYGCMPTKIMLDAAVRLRDKLPYVTTSVDMPALFKHRDGAIATLRGGIEGLLRKNKVDLVAGTGGFVGGKTIEIDIAGERPERTEFENCIIATGSVPVGLPFIEPLSDYVIDSDGATGMNEIPDSVCIIGGGVIGIEFAYIYNAFGAKVTIIEILDRILINEDSVVSEYLTDLLRKSGIEIITGERVTEMKSGGDTCTLAAGSREIEVEKILCAAGRRPNVRGLNIETLGDSMLTEKGAVAVDDNFETACKGVYAVGDANGLVMLAHAASAQGCKVVDFITEGKPIKWDPALVPRCVYIAPEIASVGRLESQVTDAADVRTALYPFASNGKAIALGKTEGFIKIVADGDGRTLGATIVGEKATEMIAAVTEMISYGRTVMDIENLVFAHPTFSESLQEAVLQVEGMAVYA
jgi:dihydrolipoamide dehydrogenase